MKKDKKLMMVKWSGAVLKIFFQYNLYDLYLGR